jgi:hypothetical protein
MICGTSGDRTIFKVATTNGFDISAFSSFGGEDEVRPIFQTYAFSYFTRSEDSFAAMLLLQDYPVSSSLHGTLKRFGFRSVTR